MTAEILTFPKRMVARDNLNADRYITFLDMAQSVAETYRNSRVSLEPEQVQLTGVLISNMLTFIDSLIEELDQCPNQSQ